MTRYDGRIYNHARLREKSKVRYMLSADHDGIAILTVENHLSVTCNEFGLIISLPKTNILPKGSSEKPSIRIDNYELGVV